MLLREAMLRRLHLVDEHYRRRARQSFAEFLRYTKPDYQPSWFHEELAGEVDQFLNDVLQKRSPRSIICRPPREGKSEQVSRRFPAYPLGRDPNLREKQSVHIDFTYTPAGDSSAGRMSASVSIDAD